MRTHCVRSLAILLLCAALPMRAESQIGGIINRAKKAVVEDNQTVNNPQLGEPFDAASLDGAIKGMRVYRARLADVASLQKQYLVNQEKHSALTEKNQRQVNDYDEAKNKNHECFSDYKSANRRNSEELAQKKMMAMASDPAAYQTFIMEMGRIAQEQQAAVKKNDTVALKKLVEQQEKLLGIDAKADSLAAVAKCGPVPPPPAAVAEIERLGKLNDDLNGRIRAAESASDVDGARAAGVTPTRFQQMRERLSTWLSKPSSLGAKEGSLLNGRKKEIEEVVKTP